MKHLFLFFVVFLHSFISISQNYNLHANKLVLCDANEIPKYETDSCHVLITISNDTLTLKNEKSPAKQVYLFSRLVEKTDQSISWTCKNNTETGVILFFLQEVKKGNYIFYIFFENVTYRYYCSDI
jgi:hypothetical protein